MRNLGYLDIGHQELGINWDIGVFKMGYWDIVPLKLGYWDICFFFFFETGIFGIPGPPLAPTYNSHDFCFIHIFFLARTVTIYPVRVISVMVIC